LILHQFASRLGSRAAAAIAPPALALLVAAALTFAQAPAERAESGFIATATADSEAPQNPDGSLIALPAFHFRRTPAQNRISRLYLPVSIEGILGAQNRVGGTARFLARASRNHTVSEVLLEPTIPSRPPAVMPDPNQGHTSSCSVTSGNSVTSSTTNVSTSLQSILDAPINPLPLFNNGPVFGMPGTIEGNFWHRTQLIGDPNCIRTNLTRRGIFVDMYATTAYQNTTSGGLKTGNSIVQNTQLSINLDTARAGLWAGGLIHFTVQSRYGSTPDNTFTAGAAAPEYTGLELPGPLFWQDTLPSDYSLIQGLSDKVIVIVGKIDGLFLADQTLFGDRFRYYFANSNFNKNVIYNNFFNTTTLAALGVWTPTQWLTLAGGVHDPYTQPNTFAANAFHEGAVNLYGEVIVTFAVAGLPSQIVPAFNWSNAPKISLGSPFRDLSPDQFPQAVNVLLGNDSPDSLPTNFKKSSFFTISNFSQYLLVKEEDPSQIPEKLRNAQPLRGVGVFGRVGYGGPEDVNMVDTDASVALLAEGLWKRRQYDSFGLGFYYNGVSRQFKNTIQQLTGGTTVRNETGTEIFYNFAVTPAINVNAGYQHIWNPLVATITANQNHADLFLIRLNLVF
jgi:hypothetical protein